MPNIKLKDGSGIEQTYTGVDTITVPLADGTGTWTYGLTDEELTFSGDLPDTFLGGILGDRLITKYGSRITFNNMSQMRYAFSNTTIEDLSIYTININNFTLQAWLGATKCRKLPRLVGTVNSSSSTCQYPFHSGWQYVRDVSELTAMIQGVDWSACTNWSFYNWFDLLYSLRGNGFPIIFYNLMKNWNSSNYSPYISLYSGAYCLDSAENIPVLSREYTSNMFTNFCQNCNRVTDITFETNNGTPYTASWKNQTIDLTNNSYPVGWSSDGSTSIPTRYSYNGTFSVADNVCYSCTTIEQAQERYNSLKTSNNWCSWSGVYVTYDGASRYIALLFSRYNHDSAVATINSLPDCSAYLATAGGTNTIKFKNYSGALTDGGGINDLTDEEIAVATAKGWTVTIV